MATTTPSTRKDSYTAEALKVKSHGSPATGWRQIKWNISFSFYTTCMTYTCMRKTNVT